MTKHKYTNQLINEKSPYLLQHAYNPVEWYPWGEDAFQKAESEDKPIFLSIGYSTCHWCHVMEKESFEDEEVAKLMNDAFVCIKVDREERPDIDSNYMTVCQMVTGHGGWPLTIIMTADKAPFFAGTYIPKKSRFGRYGMLEFIPSIKGMWDHQRDELLQNAEKITQHLNSETSYEKGERLGNSVISSTYQTFAQKFDEVYGGFGSAPKFPTPHNLMLLLRHWKSTGDERALFMVEVTLQSMRRGGIFDQLGYGFHRYSTDQKWLVPHFEKMLYDQAMLMMAFTECYQATGKEEYKRTVEEIYTYITRDMTDTEGGFYSAEDADSEGEEGKFYVWEESDIKSILASVEADVFIKAYNVIKEGNFLEEATRKKTGANILHLNTSIGMLAEKLKMPEKELRELLEASRKQLFAEREKRVHPHKDDKILVDWNGLMIAALAKAGQALDAESFTNAAERAVDFIFAKMQDQNGELYHRYREGEVAVKGFLEDYTFLTWGLIELFEATFNVTYLQKAIDLMEITLQKFWDNENGGFYLTSNDAESMLIRNKEIYDGAIPSGNSVAMYNLVRLARITARVEYEEKAALLNQAFSTQVLRVPQGHTFFLCALDFAEGPSYEVVITGKQGAEDTLDMLKSLRRMFVPNKVVIFKPTEESADITKICEFTKDLISKDGKATAYICENYNCNLPLTDTNKMLEIFN